MSDRVDIRSADQLTPDEVDAVMALVEAAVSADGVSPLDEAAMLHLRHGHQGVVHLIARQNGRLLGYAQLLNSGTRTGELVVDPANRGRGIGSALLEELVARGPVRVWAVGNRLTAQALAKSHGLRPARTLLIMERSLDDAPRVTVPDGLTIRTFRMGQDEDDWLALNARAFADHPEQGRITRRDLDDRFAEPWFDPAGFFLAVQQDRLLGFHWTKQHEDHLGEVYVLGVDPQAGGRGLGKALLAAGLSHLKQRGNTRVQLYVEADHAAAIALYSAYGFRVTSRDVMYASAASPAPAVGQAQAHDQGGERSDGSTGHLPDRPTPSR
jgi:mycothiol synthase